MKLFIQFVTFACSLAAFAIALFLTASIAVDLIAPYISPEVFDATPATNSAMGFYVSIMLVTFTLSLLLIPFLRKDISKNHDVARDENFKLIYYLAFLLPLLFFVMYLTSVVSHSLEIGIVTTNSIFKLAAIIISFTPMALIIRSLLKARSKFSLSLILSLSFYLLFAVGVSLFIFSRIGPPWVEKYIQQDNTRTNELQILISDVQRYTDAYYKLPDSLSNLLNYTPYGQLSNFEYSITGTDTYKVCTTFKLADTIQYPPHKAGKNCFDETVFVPTITPIPTPYVAPPLTCKTLNTEMVIDPKGFGYIGCDMEVTSGQIDLSKSYCEGQTTHEKEFLVRDVYGRLNRYWATLTGLDPKEIVKVFAYSQSGNKVECLPDLNQ